MFSVQSSLLFSFLLCFAAAGGAPEHRGPHHVALGRPSAHAWAARPRAASPARPRAASLGTAQALWGALLSIVSALSGHAAGVDDPTPPRPVQRSWTRALDHAAVVRRPCGAGAFYSRRSWTSRRSTDGPDALAAQRRRLALRQTVGHSTSPTRSSETIARSKSHLGKQST
mgnify:CR=1 FL=1